MLDELFNNYGNAILKQEKLKIKALSPSDFENFISNLLEELGFSVTQTPPTNDGGKDIIATKSGKTYYVECKHFSDGAVGREVIQKLVGAGIIDGGVDGFIVVTSSYFNSNAIECTTKFKNLLLLDMEDIMALVKMYLYNTVSFPKENLIRRFNLNPKTVVTMDLAECDSNDLFVNFRKYENNTITETFLLPIEKIDEVVTSLKSVPTLIAMLKTNERAKLVAKESISPTTSPVRRQPPKGIIGWQRR